VEVLTEMLRTAVLASAMAWIANRADMLGLPGGLTLAVVAWIGFPVILLTGSVIWDKAHLITAAIHAGDWLLKLLLIAVLLGVLQ
jgi:hypothetical protein